MGGPSFPDLISVSLHPAFFVKEEPIRLSQRLTFLVSQADQRRESLALPRVGSRYGSPLFSSMGSGQVVGLCLSFSGLGGGKKEDL